MTRLDCGSNPPRESILYSRSIDAPRLPLKGGNRSPGESRRKEGAATTPSVSAGRLCAPSAAGEVQTLAICGRVSRYYGGGGGGKLSYGGSVSCAARDAPLKSGTYQGKKKLNKKKKNQETPGTVSCDRQLRDCKKKTHPETSAFRVGKIKLSDVGCLPR